MKSMSLNPLNLKLDYENPRFSLFKFSNEKEIINHLLEYENLYELIDSYLKKGYMTLGERVIVLETDEEYTVLEGNRRIAAIKAIFIHQSLLKTTYREKVKRFKSEDFQVDCDIVYDRNDANYKIASKHISSIKSWKSIEKYVYYFNMYNKLLDKHNSKQSLDFIKSTTPESLAEIKKDIKFYIFLSKMHNFTKKDYPSIKPLSLLDNDVLTSRIYSALKKELKLKENSDFYFDIPKIKEETFEEILKAIGHAAWINKEDIKDNKFILNTRSFQKQSQWETILEDNKIIPGLKELIDKWNINHSNSDSDSDEDSSSLVNEDFTSKNNKVKKDEKNKNDFTNDNSQQDSVHEELNEKSPNNSNDTITKYRLFVDRTLLKEKSFYTDSDVNLIQFTKLYDNDGNLIPSKSSQYKKIKFSCSSNNILLKESTVIKNTKPGYYSISVTFDSQLDTLDTFDIFIQSKLLTSSSHYSFDFIEIITSLSKNNKYFKIVEVLMSLQKQISSQNNNETQSSVLLTSFLIRALLEYLSKAYRDIYLINEKENKNDNLPHLVKVVSEDMFNKKTNIFTIEMKKAIKAHDDIESLNGIVHDYQTTLTDQDFKRILQKYFPYINAIKTFLIDFK
ncbi:hypothetical protein AYO36_13470 [Exiguobacterium sp. KKBO11]|uniref:hypothetical protein n=1 Tax=Exiguobacterium sp. KKBO11 TaxID=1805000 RepID=UPI0007D7AD74|nr:hypothetical protein [Exiguobacterium sp. KKBO11]OAI84168.1 hypothetical protein AYO36_13470 [Exiguobacterium sp. KKBO11]